MVKLNLCVLNSIHEVYSSVYTILGEENIIIASPSLDLKVVTPDDLAHRLEKRGIEMKLITPGYIRYRLDARWQHWLRDSLLPEDAKSNRDFTPTWVYYSLGLWHAVYAPAVGEVFNLLIVFSFQVLYGYVYSIIGMLIASFMAGTGSGGAFTTLIKKRIRRDFRLFFLFETAIMLFAASLPLLSTEFVPGLDKIPSGVVEALFFFVCFAGGFSVGAQFPIAGRLLQRRAGKTAEYAGTLYESDLFGGFMGGVLGGAVLLPVLGLTRVCVVVVLFKMVSLFLLLLFSKRLRVAIPR